MHFDFHVMTDEGAIFTPWTDGWTVGFEVTAPDQPTRYLMLNPSIGNDSEKADPVDDTNVFLYLEDDPKSRDNPLRYINIWAAPVNEPTDQTVVDAIATLLGTKADWCGADDLELIANLVGTVRPNPGAVDADSYADLFRSTTGRDVDPHWNRSGHRTEPADLPAAMAEFGATLTEQERADFVDTADPQRTTEAADPSAGPFRIVHYSVRGHRYLFGNPNVHPISDTTVPAGVGIEFPTVGDAQDQARKALRSLTSVDRVEIVDPAGASVRWGFRPGATGNTFTWRQP